MTYVGTSQTKDMARPPLADSFESLKRAFRWLIKTLTVNEEFLDLQLSIPETRTTAIKGDVGWWKRPPAVVACPECNAAIYQHRSMNAIDCPECWAEFSRETFPDLELLYLTCPKCKSQMQYGVRHPNAFDVPQWATCHNCRYHWEFAHAYRS